MKFRALFIASLLLIGSSASAGLLHRSGSSVTNSFDSLHTCGGGFVVQADVPYSTGVRFANTDVSAMALIWGTDNAWHNLITASSMAGTTTGFGVVPTTGASQVYQGIYTDVIAIAGADSDSTVAYMFYNGLIFVSTNIDPAHPDSITWTDTGFSQVTDAQGGNWRQSGKRLAVDPHNPDHVLVGTMQNGVRETTNGRHVGGATWTQISTGVLPLSQNFGNLSSPAYNIAFDPASGTNGGGLTNGVYIFTASASNSGVYRTTNGSTASLSLTSSGPTTAMTMMKAAPTGGVIWAVDSPSASGGSFQNGTVWRFDAGAGTWTHPLTTPTYHSIAISAQNPLHMVALDVNGGNVNKSTDGGSTWSGIINQGTLSAGDTPWLAQISTQLTPADINFDPLQTDVLLFNGGQGFWAGALPTTSMDWTTQAKGIEEFIGETIAVPSSNHPSVGGQDLGVLSYDVTNNTGCLSNPFALVKANVNNGLARSQVAAAPGVSNFLAAKSALNFATNMDFSGYSNDGFVGNYVPFNSGFNTTVNSSAMSSNGGLVRISMNTTGLTTWANGSGSIVCALSFNRAVFRIIQGQCFAATVVNGTTLDLQGSSFQGALTSVNADYQIFVPTPPRSNYNGWLNVTGASSNGGKIQLGTIGSSQVGVQNGWPVCAASVGGTTEANGCWIAEQVSGNNITLGPTSTFTHSYTGGGVVTTNEEANGSVAAASSSNIVFIPGSNANLACTTDGGQTWPSTVTNANLPKAWTTVTVGASAGGTTVTVANASLLPGWSDIEIPMDDGRIFKNVVTSINTGTNVITFSSPVPTGRSISSGASVFNGTGWPFEGSIHTQVIDSDKVTANTFFAVNTALGILKWTNCGAATVINNSAWPSSFQAGGAFNVELKTVQGESGHLFFAAGPQGGEPGVSHPAPTKLWRACNGDTNSANGLTMQSVSGTFEPLAVGFGAPAPGHTYPAIYYWGWYDATGNVQANATLGLWRSIDDPNHGNSGAGVTCTAGATFQKIADWPKNWNVVPNDIQGDPSIYGQVYMTGVMGSFVGTFN